MSDNFSAKETLAIYGECATTITFVRDGFLTEEKTFPRMQEAVDYPTRVGCVTVTYFPSHGRKRTRRDRLQLSLADFR